MTVNILGTDYEVITQTEEENPKLKEAYGLCEMYSKKIVLSDIKEDVMNVDNIEAFTRKVVRHEIVHAFFAESGLRSNSDYAQNEELVDWIAIQFPKIAKAFKELEVEE